MKHQEDLFPELEKHTCESYTRGNWIISKCTQCDYVRHFNWKKGDIIIKGNRMALHRGSYVPTPKGNSSKDLF